MWRCVLWIVSASCGYRWLEVASANTLPTTVQLGGAIVAAVEHDAEQEDALHMAQREEQPLRHEELWQHLRNDPSVAALARLFTDLGEGGRGKYQRRRKMMKYLYPLLVGILVVKTVVLPLVLKMLTALSTSSFVMSKIALATAGLLALKWLLAGGTDNPKERTHLEIVHLPPFAKPFNRGGGGGWSDMSLSGSNVLDVKTPKQHSKYIPLGSFNDEFAETDASSASGYRYAHSQHNYDAAFDGKPFL